MLDRLGRHVFDENASPGVRPKGEFSRAEALKRFGPFAFPPLFLLLPVNGTGTKPSHRATWREASQESRHPASTCSVRVDQCVHTYPHRLWRPGFASSQLKLILTYLQ